LNEAVLDASVVVKWFASEEHGSLAARALRDDYHAGRLTVVVPTLLYLELLNVAGRRWGWDEASLHELATALDDLAFDVGDPGLLPVASWVARGLTAYDAAYVALAEERGLPLVSDDEQITRLAPEICRPLAVWLVVTPLQRPLDDR